MSVSRCVCLNVTFEEIKRIAVTEGGGLVAAHRATGCGGRCGLCVPYMLLMLKPGETSFPVMWEEDFRQLGILAKQMGRLEQFLRQQEAQRSGVA